jgi:hypothetical protein
MATEPPNVLAGPQPSPLVFWLLVLMGFAGLAPCVLLPEWREYQSLRLIEQREGHELAGLHRVVERRQIELDALQTDPGAVARLARRDLRFHRPGETVIGLAVRNPPPADHEPFLPQPVAPSPWLTKYAGYLPPLDYDAVFCDGRSRTTIIAMSLSVIAVALVLYRSF